MPRKHERHTCDIYSAIFSLFLFSQDISTIAFCTVTKKHILRQTINSHNANQYYRPHFHIYQWIKVGLIDLFKANQTIKIFHVLFLLRNFTTVADSLPRQRACVPLALYMRCIVRALPAFIPQSSKWISIIFAAQSYMRGLGEGIRRCATMQNPIEKSARSAGKNQKHDYYTTTSHEGTKSCTRKCIDYVILDTLRSFSSALFCRKDRRLQCFQMFFL